jgi:hypothetical protein
MSNKPNHNAMTFDGFDTPETIWEQKVGYDFANKRMIAKVYKHLYNVLTFGSNPTWTNVIREMLVEDNRLNDVNVRGYYSTIRKNLKDIGVIQYNNHKALSKGPNWDRFYSDEDWSWFKTNTNRAGYGTIIK